MLRCTRSPVGFWKGLPIGRPQLTMFFGEPKHQSLTDQMAAFCNDRPHSGHGPGLRAGTIFPSWSFHLTAHIPISSADFISSVHFHLASRILSISSASPRPWPYRPVAPACRSVQASPPISRTLLEPFNFIMATLVIPTSIGLGDK